MELNVFIETFLYLQP